MKDSEETDCSAAGFMAGSREGEQCHGNREERHGADRQ